MQPTPLHSSLWQAAYGRRSPFVCFSATDRKDILQTDVFPFTVTLMIVTALPWHWLFNWHSHLTLRFVVNEPMSHVLVTCTVSAHALCVCLELQCFILLTPSALPLQMFSLMSITRPESSESLSSWRVFRFSISGLPASRSFGTSRFCTGSNVFTLWSLAMEKGMTLAIFAMCHAQAQTQLLGPLDRCCAHCVNIMSQLMVSYLQARSLFEMM